MNEGPKKKRSGNERIEPELYANPKDRSIFEGGGRSANSSAEDIEPLVPPPGQEKELVFSDQAEEKLDLAVEKSIIREWITGFNRRHAEALTSMNVSLTEDDATDRGITGVRLRVEVKASLAGVSEEEKENIIAKLEQLRKVLTTLEKRIEDVPALPAPEQELNVFDLLDRLGAELAKERASRNGDNSERLELTADLRMALDGESLVPPSMQTEMAPDDITHFEVAELWDQYREIVKSSSVEEQCIEALSSQSKEAVAVLKVEASFFLQLIGAEMSHSRIDMGNVHTFETISNPRKLEALKINKTDYEYFKTFLRQLYAAIVAVESAEAKAKKAAQDSAEFYEEDPDGEV